MKKLSFRNNTERRAYEKALAELKLAELKLKDETPKTTKPQIRKEVNKLGSDEIDDILKGYGVSKKSSKQNIKDNNTTEGGQVVPINADIYEKMRLQSFASDKTGMQTSSTFRGNVNNISKRQAMTEVVDIRSYVKPTPVEDGADKIKSPESKPYESKVVEGKKSEVLQKTDSLKPKPTLDLGSNKNSLSNEKSTEVKEEPKKLSYFEQFLRELERGKQKQNENKLEKAIKSNVNAIPPKENQTQNIKQTEKSIDKTKVVDKKTIVDKSIDRAANKKTNNVSVEKTKSTSNTISPTYNKKSITKGKAKKKRSFDIDIVTDGFDGDII